MEAGEPQRSGPNLAGVYNREAGRNQEYNYSSAMAGTDLVWDAATLDRFLADPRTVVPGSRMVQGVPDAEEREKIVEALKQI